MSKPAICNFWQFHYVQGPCVCHQLLFNRRLKSFSKVSIYTDISIMTFLTTCEELTSHGVGPIYYDYLQYGFSVAIIASLSNSQALSAKRWEQG